MSFVVFKDRKFWHKRATTLHSDLSGQVELIVCFKQWQNLLNNLLFELL